MRFAEDIPDPMSLLIPKEILVISLKEKAYQMLASIGHTLVPNPFGIYTKTQLFPVLRPGESAFAMSTGKKHGFDEIGNLDDDICNARGEVIIPRAFMRDKARMLSINGFYPISALQLLKASVDLNMRRFCPHAAPFTNEHNAAASFLKPEYQHLLYENELDVFISDLIEEMHDFVVKDTWNIYFTKVKTDNLHIEKSIDYRIFDWTRIQYNKLHPEED